MPDVKDIRPVTRDEMQALADRLRDLGNQPGTSPDTAQALHILSLAIKGVLGLP